MSEFNTSKQKLRTIWERVEKNSNDIQNKDNTDQFEFFTNLLRQQHIKVPIQLFDSGDINVVPNTDFIATGVFTALKGEKMPTKASYSQDIDIQVPEIFLPFVKYSVEINSLPDTEIHGMVLYDRSDFVDDSVEIRGDSTLIFKLDPLPTLNETIGGVENVFPDTFFTGNDISFDLSKRVFRGTITKNDDSVKELNVINITTTVITATGTGNCVGSDNTEVFNVDVLNDPDHKFISLNATSFTAVGNFLVTTFTDTGSECTQNTVITESVTKTFSFASVDNYKIVLGDNIIINSSDIKSQSFVENNRWLFWSTLKQKLFNLVVFGADGDFKEIVATNFPDTDDDDTLPYTSITLKRNLVEVSDEIGRESVTLGFERIVTSEREFKNYVQTSISSASIPTYRFRLGGSFIILSPATAENPDTTDFPVYDDIYTVVGTTYSRTTTNHSILSKITFLPETQDVTINIKAFLVNPLYWREQRRYNKNDF